MKNAPFLSRAIVVSVLLAAGGMLASCATTNATTTTAHDEPLSGEIRAKTFTVEEHERIVFEGDLHIIADEQVAVLGEMLGQHGATIEITAPSITVQGTIQAGDGEDRDGVLEHGQNGGGVILNAPRIDLTGATIAAGRGGHAGPAGNGGDGGSIVLNDVVDVISVRTRLIGGEAGRAGAGINGHGEAARRGGDGGAGGGLQLHRAPRDAG